MPGEVRAAIWLIGSALLARIGGAVFTRAFIGQSIAQAIVTMSVFGALLVAIGYRQNWARLTYAFLFVVGLVAAIVPSPGAAAIGPARAVVSILLTVVQGSGLVCLFLPRASAWYHHRAGAV